MNYCSSTNTSPTCRPGSINRLYRESNATSISRKWKRCTCSWANADRAKGLRKKPSEHRGSRCQKGLGSIPMLPTLDVTQNRRTITPRSRSEQSSAGRHARNRELAQTNPVFRDDNLPADQRINRSQLAAANVDQLQQLLPSHIAKQISDSTGARGTDRREPSLIYKMEAMPPQFYTQQRNWMEKSRWRRKSRSGQKRLPSRPGQNPWQQSLLISRPARRPRRLPLLGSHGQSQNLCLGRQHPQIH